MKIKDLRFYKYFILVFNISIIAVGVFGIVFSILYMRDQKMRPEMDTPPICRGFLAFFIILACCLIGTAMVGTFGAIKQSTRILYAQLSLYVILMSVELIVGVAVALIYAWMGDSHDLRLNFYDNSTIEEYSAKEQAWSRLQTKHFCCGVDGPQDYAIVNRDVPPSCCSTVHPLREGGAKRQLHTICLNERTYFMRGCDEALKSQKFRNERLIALGTIALSLMELTLIVLSLGMAHRIRRQRRQLQQNLQAHFET